MNDRILIAGTSSGCGKTTVACAILAALKKRDIDIAAFKCGPDYIDPMFHRAALGIPAHNLDPYFSTEEQLRGQIFGCGHSLSVIEGVMGYYDGIGTAGCASTYTAAEAVEAPVILVVNARGMYTSAGAILAGFLHFRPDSRIRGVIFNGVSAMVYTGLKQIAEDAGVKPLGFLPRDESLSIESRHLGLVTASELGDIKERLYALGALAEEHLDIDGIVRIAGTAPPLTVSARAIAPVGKLRIAVARDEAFCFLYQENLELLTDLGAELCFFSPLRDASLPDNVQGLYLPGGYPELYLEGLSDNTPMRSAIREAINNGLPTIAECGGFLYLHDSLDGAAMAGVIHTSARRTEGLQRFGYAELTAQKENLLCHTGESIRAHAFHYYESEAPGDGFIAKKASGKGQYACIHASDTLYAGFPHLYFPANPEFAVNFIRKAEKYEYTNHS